MPHRRIEPEVQLQQKQQWTKQAQHCDNILSLLHQLNGNYYQRTVHCALGRFQFSPSNFSAHQSHDIKIEQLLDRCQHAYFIRHWYSCLSTAEHQLQEPRFVKQSEENVLFGEDMKKKLRNPDVLHYICKRGRRRSESLASFLNSDFMKRQRISA